MCAPYLENPSTPVPSGRARRRQPPPRGPSAPVARRRATRSRDATPARSGPPARRAARRARLERVEAVGKNLLLGFEGGLVLRSHLRMSGRWRVVPAGRGARRPALARPARRARGGGALERARARARHAGGAPARRRHPREPPDLDRIVAALRADPAGRSATRCSTSGSSRGSGTSGAPRRSGVPGSRRWLPLGEADDEELRDLLDGTAELMRASVGGERVPRRSTAAPAARARAAAAGSAPGARATRTAPPTGAPAASADPH